MGWIIVLVGVAVAAIVAVAAVDAVAAHAAGVVTIPSVFPMWIVITLVSVAVAAIVAGTIILFVFKKRPKAWIITLASVVIVTIVARITIPSVFPMWIVITLVSVAVAAIIILLALNAIKEEGGGKGKWKVWLEVSLVVGFGIIIALLQYNQNELIADRQEEQNELIADRQGYTAAVEHLSSNSPAVRLKGIRDLCKYSATDERAAEIQNLFNDQIKFFTRNKDYQDSNSKAPSKDIQILLDILSGRTEFECAPISDQKIDWSHAFLKGAKLENAKLPSAVLWLADLQSVVLKDANLQGAVLTHADLKNAVLWNTKLQGAELLGAELQGKWMQGADLRGMTSDKKSFGDLYVKKISFAKRIRSRMNKPTDVTGILLKDFMTNKDITSKEEKERYLMKRGAILGKYTSEEAEQWIQEYNEARKERTTAIK